jgi:Zn finger protein HypA/HybF involved in hydrogenase expression
LTKSIGEVWVSGPLIILQDVARPWRCPNCGQLLRSEAVSAFSFCEDCGGGEVTLGEIIGKSSCFEDAILDSLDKADGGWEANEETED